MTRIYVGLNGLRRVVFHANAAPTFASHGHLFNAVIGPFATKRGAEFMARHGQGNPHVQCVADAERIASRA